MSQSPHLAAFRVYLQKQVDTVERTENSHHKAILRNYQRHNALEWSGRSHEIFTPELTVDTPVYLNSISGPLLRYEGRESVIALYDALNAETLLARDESLFVGDSGVASTVTVVIQRTGRELVRLGHSVEHGDETLYFESFPIAMFWPYTADARMIGEHTYRLPETTITRAEPDELFTTQECQEIAAEFLL